MTASSSQHASSPLQLYNLNNPLRARSYWKTGIIMGIVHGIVIFLVVYYSAVS
jgi:hypothetical protein